MHYSLFKLFIWTQSNTPISKFLVTHLVLFAMLAEYFLAGFQINLPWQFYSFSFLMATNCLLQPSRNKAQQKTNCDAED